MQIIRNKAKQILTFPEKLFTDSQLLKITINAIPGKHIYES